jgi:serine/threonine protein kinase
LVDEISATDVPRRPEQWARDRFALTLEQVSRHTFRVIDRFTAERYTAKVFRVGGTRQLLRDEEFVAFNKQQVDASIVRHLQTTSIGDVPSIITENHIGFATYVSLQETIHQSHPGFRFKVACLLLHRLFAALGSIHFHGIVHGNVSSDSVLLRFVDQKIDQVLLVDYSTTRHFAQGAPMPPHAMNFDGKAAMELIENCCDIRTFRNGPAKDALCERLLLKRTVEAMNEYQVVRRVVEEFVEVKGHSMESVLGKKLNKLVNLKGNAWSSTKAKQAENLTRREVAASSKSKIDARV